MNEAEYKKRFGIDPIDKDRVEKALDHALDIRKFEIELYWKRATYFWTLIASAFAAHFVILNAEHMQEKNFVGFSVVCVGFLFTFAWLQVNRGSKQWQENWENHVDMLEDEVIGPLYKTVLSRPSAGGEWLERFITGPAQISVSKTNQIVNVFTMAIWTVLGWNVLPQFGRHYPLSLKHLSVIFVTVGACAIIVCKGKTHTKSYTHTAKLRETKIWP